MKLFNTLTRKIEEFKPIKEGHVSIYSCGPTVYDRAHIGNLSAYIFSDTLRRALELEGYKVRQVMNYTDVDDKTIKISQEKYPDLEPKEALRKTTDEYIGLFLQDMTKIGIDTDKIDFVRATDNIDKMQQSISDLYKKGFAYIADDGVYFSIDAYKKSGKTYGQLLNISSDNTSASRIDNDEYDKESIRDFALWKKSKANEPSWEFKLDGQRIVGRPGWHIECSAMSEKAFGLPFDIHTGGIDLIFPHHENEIAQSTSLREDNKMANFFVHNNHILVDGRKMAKSAKNFYTLDDIINKGCDPLAFRLLVLQAHYRSEINFTWENLDAAQNRLNKWRNFANLKWQPKLEAKITPVYEQQIDRAEYLHFVKQGLDNDINTPSIIDWPDRLSDKIAALPDKAIQKKHFDDLIITLDQIFGLQLFMSEDISSELKQLITDREYARKDKDWAKSDEIRNKLIEQGIGIRDTDHGPVWYRL